MKRIKVYIASCYTYGWMPDNVRRQLEAKHVLLDQRFVPFAPLENHFAEIFQHRKDSEWFEWDIEWLKACDILVRIKAFKPEGSEIPSPGSEIEERTAKENGMLVFQFNSIEELKYWAVVTNQEKLWKDIKIAKQLV